MKEIFIIIERNLVIAEAGIRETTIMESTIEQDTTNLTMEGTFQTRIENTNRKEPITTYAEVTTKT